MPVEMLAKIWTIHAGLILLACICLCGCGDGGRTDGALHSTAPSQCQGKEKANASLAVCVDEAGADCKIDVSKEDDRNVERILTSGLLAASENRCYDDVAALAEELWGYLEPMRHSDPGYVICAAARLQAFVEHELASVHVPKRTVDPGPIHYSEDGIRYRFRNVNDSQVGILAEEEKAILRTRDYLDQLEHFAKRYPNRIDSQYMFNMYLSLDETSRNNVMARVVSILGRAPRWEKWQRR